ncbi:sigma-70 family RNA polymerase sigma factor [Clostridium baratii]|nr:helix-turn-helix domain-containing protein [Clostridium baratii]
MNDLNLLKLAKKNDMNAKEELIVKYTPLIRKQIKKYSYIDCYDSEDLMQYGILSILKAINTFDLDKSSSF